jgi:hypothetical protein
MNGFPLAFTTTVNKQTNDIMRVTGREGGERATRQGLIGRFWDLHDLTSAAATFIGICGSRPPLLAAGSTALPCHFHRSALPTCLLDYRQHCSSEASRRLLWVIQIEFFLCGLKPMGWVQRKPTGFHTINPYLRLQLQAMVIHPAQLSFVAFLGFKLFLVPRTCRPGPIYIHGPPARHHSGLETISDLMFR